MEFLQTTEPMKTKSPSRIPRRKFLQTTARVAATGAIGSALLPSPVRGAETPASNRMIGIQVGAVSFVDEGVDNVLDIFVQKGAINTVFLTTFTYGRGLAGRQIPGQPFPDHGSQESDEQTFRGGNYAIPHARFYQHTALKETRAPEHGSLDIVASVLPEARKRGLKLFR